MRRIKPSGMASPPQRASPEITRRDCLSWYGEKASGTFLIDQARLVDSNVEGVVVKGSGHWLMEEAPREVLPQLIAFINKSQQVPR